MAYEISDDVSMPLSTIIEVTEVSRRSPSPKTILLTDVSQRLYKRKRFYKQLTFISNVMCTLGLFGVVLMIIENELYFRNLYHKQTVLSFFIKSSITISTIILLICIIYYKYLDLTLFTVNNSLNSIRIGLTGEKQLIIIFELIVCSIHPFPRHFPYTSETILNKTSSRPHPDRLTSIDTDLALGLPMFIRIYLLCRCIFYHSHLVNDTFSQSLGYLNRLKINFIFLLKTYLEQWPTRCLTIISISFFLIGSWCLHACNYDLNDRRTSMLDAMWLFIVTFTTVGYGDLSPSTYCGRTISAIIGLIGIFATALLVSVLAQKLQLTREEKYVHNFVLDFESSKQRKHQAANIIKYAMKIWLFKRRNQLTSLEYRQMKRKFIRAVHSIHQLKYQQKILIDNCTGFPELVATQRETNMKIEDQLQYSTKIDHLEETLSNMNQTIFKLQNTLDQLVNKISQ